MTISENIDYSFTPELPCKSSSLDPSTITYQLASIDGGAPPSYLSFDANSGVVSVSAQNVSADTDVKFYVDTSINGNSNPIHKLINLKILNWLVKYCQKWTNSNALKWDVWDSGYSLRSSSWYASNSNSSDSENSI